MGYYSFIKKRNLNIYNNVNESRGHYAKQNKPVTVRHVGHDSQNHRIVKVKVTETESRMVVFLSSSGNEWSFFNYYNVSVKQSE